MMLSACLKKIKPMTKAEFAAWQGLYRFSRAEIDQALKRGGGKEAYRCRGKGQYYKGILPSGQEVSIKQICDTDNSSSFSREVECLTGRRQPNIISLIGCCHEDSRQYLVYEYCSAGNLSQCLLRDYVLTWERRVQILRDCAIALRFLHHHTEGCTIHGDIKPANILLTEDLVPKLSGFHFARLLDMEETEVPTDVHGTIAYMDPEFAATGILTSANDIYSFGLLILLVLSGMELPGQDLNTRNQLITKAMDTIMGKLPLKEFKDPRLNGNVNTEDFSSLLQLAVHCVTVSSKTRPTIGIVCIELDRAWKNTLAQMMSKEEKS